MDNTWISVGLEEDIDKEAWKDLYKKKFHKSVQSTSQHSTLQHPPLQHPPLQPSSQNLTSSRPPQKHFEMGIKKKIPLQIPTMESSLPKIVSKEVVKEVVTKEIEIIDLNDDREEQTSITIVD